ncbi:MAG TPA: DUF4157 domain-containing protein [Blastocatellia bacterium]|nr:DUF4157 domain-containing protein [Blastocatellia bacterium]
MSGTRFGHDFSGVPLQTKPVISATGDVYKPEIDSAADEPVRAEHGCACGASCPKCKGLARRVSNTINTNGDRMTLSQPGDDLEKEADRAADDVMRIPETALESPVTSNSDAQPPSLSRHEIPHGNTPGATQGQPAPEAIETGVPSRTESEIRSALGSGAPIAQSLRNFFEPRFGHDFSQVRIHTGQGAASTSQNLRAAAFTFGSDIFFNAGQFRPETAAGRSLLAHELAHVLQQQAGRVSRRVIQRAWIGYRQLTWADFMANPPAAPGPEGAEVQTKFDLIPSYTPTSTVRATTRKCGSGRGRSTEVEATYKPDIADFSKPEAQMNQDASWAIERYTGNGTNFCAGAATRCESDFNNFPAQAVNTCRQAAGVCVNAFKQGGKSFGQYFNNTPVSVTREADCATTFFNQCRQEYDTTVRPILVQLARDWLRLRDQAQTDYDFQTTNGSNAAQQRAWEAKIAGGLTGYVPTAAPAPAAAPPGPGATPTTPAPTNPPTTPAPAPTH